MRANLASTRAFACLPRLAAATLSALLACGFVACDSADSDRALPPHRSDSGMFSDGSLLDASDARLDVAAQPEVGPDTTEAPDVTVLDSATDVVVVDAAAEVGVVDAADASPGCGDKVCDDDESCSSCPKDCGECPTLDPVDEANVLAAAKCVRNNPAYAVYFEADATRAEAYEMMTLVIRDIRTHGTNASRCIANNLPPSNPYRWCSDALVVGPPGKGITIDIYQGWPDHPGKPQVHISGYNSTGELTADLNEPFTCQ